MTPKIFLFLVAFAALAFSQGPYLIVFDSSGSMGESVSDLGATKMEAAKEAANSFIDRTNAEIGVVVFSDCDSVGNINSGGIRLVQDFTTNKPLLKQKMDALTPGGDRAIANALDEASTYIQNSRGQGTIILITNGEETCGGDPVAAAGSIYNDNIGTVNVIGYRIGGSAEEAARQIAQAGGGGYYPVQNADELESALSQLTGGSLNCCPSTALLLALPLFVAFANRRFN